MFFILSVFKVNLLIAYNLHKLAKICKINIDILSTFSVLYTQFSAQNYILKSAPIRTPFICDFIVFIGSLGNKKPCKHLPYEEGASMYVSKYIYDGNWGIVKK